MKHYDIPKLNKGYDWQDAVHEKKKKKKKQPIFSSIIKTWETISIAKMFWFSFVPDEEFYKSTYEVVWSGVKKASWKIFYIIQPSIFNSDPIFKWDRVDDNGKLLIRDEDKGRISRFEYEANNG